MKIEKDVPIVECDEIIDEPQRGKAVDESEGRKVRIQIICPHCGKKHFHGVDRHFEGLTHRMAHCHGGRSYYIRGGLK